MNHRMGWKGALRSYQASARRHARDQQRKARAHLREVKEELRRKEHELSENAVARYELQVSLLTELHRECGDPIDWTEVARAAHPKLPEPVTTRTRAAEQTLAAYRPGLAARVFGGAKKKAALLEANIEAARTEDARETEANNAKHDQDCRDVEEGRRVAEGILRGDTSSYVEVLNETEAFKDDIGKTIDVHVPRADLVVIHLGLPPKDAVVPAEELHLTKSGKLSSKPMPKTRGFQLYQHYVCCTAVRVAREVFAALPVKWVLATVRVDMLDESTGHTKSMPVLSLIAPRQTVDGFNHATVDAVEAMKHFLHRMDYKNTSGLASVVGFTIEDLPADAGTSASL
jgi:hypothetical protein